MNRFHFLSEAELDVKKNELLSQLSDEDLAMIVGELDEAERLYGEALKGLYV